MSAHCNAGYQRPVNLRGWTVLTAFIDPRQKTPLPVAGRGDGHFHPAFGGDLCGGGVMWI